MIAKASMAKLIHLIRSFKYILTELLGYCQGKRLICL